MSRHRAPYPTADRRPVVAAILLAVLLAACGSGGPASPPSDQPSGAPSTAGPAIDVGSLLADPQRDGTVVRVTGFFLGQDGVAQLCDVVLESYPPQCGGSVVRLTGEVPQAVLDALESTDEPQLAKATWGQVAVTGTFRASGADGEPTIELTSIEVVGGAE